MILTPRIEGAIKLCSELHRNQTRKNENKTPYNTHLFSVALLISQITDDEDIIIAGLMHDSLEDVEGYTYEKLSNDCGKRVAEIVGGVTETREYRDLENKELRWLKTREEYLKNLKIAPNESAIVSLADCLHNTESFLEGAKDEGEMFFKRFGSSLKNKYLFNLERIKIIKEKIGENQLTERLDNANEKLKELTESVTN